MKNIIVPLDFSNESMNGLKMSLMLAEKAGANIQMVHVIGRYTDNNELFEMENYQANQKFEEILQKCRERVEI